ncbi:hypothetical protein XI02_13755 [Bradyrhizobium sp. CCBAU 21365]|uniref:hypothetical protein n=1 Tax=Bradyrhizobium sp. CCBAU 21365 TaxID=1325083 RepID=UPI00188BA335|nr:hypothetical protein [Bradyrhizobium sp. CCBAU 21365]QOZ15923.1 hypothetical protein XI02_13755 [Bradyrhizobium sp. CCBAU 21365]
MTGATTTAESSQAAIIDFGQIGKSRPPRRSVKKRPDHPDADLIESCIECAMQMAAGKAPYKIDPTDSEFAAFCDDICRSRADRALCAVLDMNPSTLDGLRAKAGLVEAVVDDWTDFPGGIQLDELHTNLLLSLAKDVIRFQRAAMIEKTSHLSIAST